MSGSLIGALRVTLGIDTAAFEEGLGVAQKRLAAAGATMQAVGDRMSSIGQTLTLGVTAPLLAAGAAAVQGAQSQAQAMAQVNAALSSMGPVAGKTADQLLAASDAMEMNSLFDGDEILRKVTANMLTFGNIAGAQFDRAQQAAVDLATRMGTDLQSATIMVGKALNDPIKGIGALRKVGIQLTADQENLIKSMVATGNTARAQSIILGELERQFGGAAKAAADTSPWRQAQVALGQVGDQVGELILPVLQKLAGWVEKTANAFKGLSPETQSFIVGAAAIAAAFGPVLIGAAVVVSAIGTLIPVFSALGPVLSFATSAIGLVSKAFLGLMANPVILGAAVVIGGIYLAWKNWDKIKPIIDAVGKAISDWWNGNVQPILDGVMNKVKAVGKFFSDYFGAQIKIVVAGVSALLRGDFAGAWEMARMFVSNAIQAALKVIDTLAPGALAAVKALYQGVKTWIADKLSAIWDGAKQMIQSVGDKFKWLWDVVVGHSYIPDMVDGIGANMARLDDVMVKPAQKAADKTAKAFEDLRGDVRGILDELFPLQAELLSTMEKIDKLDQAKAKGWLDDKTYETARGQLESKAAGLRSEIAGPPAIIAAMEDVPLVTVAVGDLSDVLGAMPAIASEAEIALEEYGRALGDNIMGGLRDVLSGRTSFRDMLKDLFGNFLYRLTTDALKNIETAVFGDKGLGGFLGGLFSSLIGVRAIGGPVLANQPYVVGEKRPELFVPSTAGRIVPNLNGMGRGAGSGPIEVRVTKSNLFDVEVTRIADGRVANGIAGYDRNVGSRVKDNMSRRG